MQCLVQLASDFDHSISVYDVCVHVCVPVCLSLFFVGCNMDIYVTCIVSPVVFLQYIFCLHSIHFFFLSLYHWFRDFLPTIIISHMLRNSILWFPAISWVYTYLFLLFPFHQSSAYFFSICSPCAFLCHCWYSLVFLLTSLPLFLPLTPTCHLTMQLHNYLLILCLLLFW